MSYCLNPACPHPKNPLHVELCQTCKSKLLLRDRYRVVKALGQGGFGATFLARDELLPGSPSCVVKQLRPATTSSHLLPMARELFEREARTLGKIGNHPQVPRLLDFFEDNEQFYLVQEYISGLTLQQEIKENGPMSEAGVKQFLSEILPLLRDIHKQNVIHRDIKPANIIRREQDRKLVLIDFGAVKNQVNQDVNNSDQTALTNFAIGTPGYAPPEQMALRPVFASDIYAVGVTCIYLLTGKSPKDLEYNPSTGEMVWRKHIQISDHFADVLKKMLEASVRHRYKTADAILKELDLVPYIDSLREGLTIKPNHPPNSTSRAIFSEELNIPSNPSAPSTPTSATDKLAAQIRARRERNARAGGPYTSGGQSNTGIPGQRGIATSLRGDSNTVGRPRTPAKMDADAVLTAYLKGRKDFASLDLSGLDLQKANLSRGIFHQSKVSRTNLQGSDLTEADFGRASLVKSNLRDAILVRAYFSYTDFEGADLRGADLSYSYLNNANLKGANLCGTNLTGAKITEEQLAQAKTNWTTVLPNGKRGFW
jgi:serine/threonine-protein kinase